MAAVPATTPIAPAIQSAPRQQAAEPGEREQHGKPSPALTIRSTDLDPRGSIHVPFRAPADGGSRLRETNRAGRKFRPALLGCSHVIVSERDTVDVDLVAPVARRGTPAILEALPAIHGLVVAWLEGDFRVLSTAGADGRVHLAWAAGVSAAATAAVGRHHRRRSRQRSNHPRRSRIRQSRSRRQRRYAGPCVPDGTPGSAAARKSLVPGKTPARQR